MASQQRINLKITRGSKFQFSAFLTRISGKYVYRNKNKKSQFPSFLNEGSVDKICSQCIVLKSQFWFIWLGSVENMGALLEIKISISVFPEYNYWKICPIFQGSKYLLPSFLTKISGKYLRFSMDQNLSFRLLWLILVENICVFHGSKSLIPYFLTKISGKYVYSTSY